MKHMLKNIGAIVSGFIAVVLLSIITDILFEKTGIFPPQTDPQAYVPWMLIVALCYRSAYTLLGGYVTARLSPKNPIGNIKVSMVLGAILGVAGAIGGWKLGNHWYPILLAVSGPICIYVGGRMDKRFV